MPRSILILLAMLPLTAPLLAEAAPQTYPELASLLINLMNSASGVVVALAIALFFWGVVSQMINSRNKAVEHRYFLWGVIAIVVMVSIWGIVDLLVNTFITSSGADSGGTTFCVGLNCQ